MINSRARDRVIYYRIESRIERELGKIYVKQELKYDDLL